MNFDFFITSMPASRPADYYLGCLDSCVYLDFNERNGQVILKRISFDGFGCCEPKVALAPLSSQGAVLFLQMMKTNHIDQVALGQIIQGTLATNRNHLWQDALEKYGFLS